MDQFLESGKEEVNIWYKSAGFSIVSKRPETHTCLALRLCHGVLIKSKSPLSLCPLLPPSFSQILLPWFYLWWSWMTYLSQDRSQRLYQHFPSILQSPNKYTISGPEWTPLLVQRHSNSAMLPQHCPLSAVQSEHLKPHLYCGIRGPIFNSEINTFPKNVYMKALARISLPAADPTWMIRSCGFSGEVDLWTRAWGIYEM